jgi:hypothetical protein
MSTKKKVNFVFSSLFFIVAFGLLTYFFASHMTTCSDMLKRSAIIKSSTMFEWLGLISIVYSCLMATVD